ncbi:MAG: metal ABC transporter permease [Actinomycetaceae bacterium]|nr:metal ABC transporter permease [Actinomycetaceae bacterium]
MSIRDGVLLLALVTALCCALPGIFIVLRKQSMITDAISHAVLPGIVLGAIITGKVNSPLLIVGAALTGLLVVLGAEYLDRSGLVTEDGAQGLLFPALFSLGVILLSVYYKGSHLSQRSVLTGDLNFAAFIHWETENYDLGPQYMWVMIVVLLINIAYLALFWRELVMSTFDREHAQTIGIKTGILHYGLMALVALTIVAAFKAAGSVLVIAFLIVPAAIGVLVSKTMWQMVAVTVGSSLFAAYLGFEIAYQLKISTSPMMSLVEGAVFLVAFSGMFIVRWVAQRRAKKESMAEVVSESAL